MNILQKLTSLLGKRKKYMVEENEEEQNLPKRRKVQPSEGKNSEMLSFFVMKQEKEENLNNLHKSGAKFEDHIDEDTKNEFSYHTKRKDNFGNNSIFSKKMQNYRKKQTQLSTESIFRMHERSKAYEIKREQKEENRNQFIVDKVFSVCMKEILQDLMEEKKERVKFFREVEATPMYSDEDSDESDGYSWGYYKKKRKKKAKRKEIVYKSISIKKKIEIQHSWDKLYKELLKDHLFMEKEFLPLKKMQLKNVNKKVLKNYRNRQEVLIKHFNRNMTREKLLCLRDTEWLNDEVMNFYMKLMEDRNKRYHEAQKSNSNTNLNDKPKKKIPDCHFFNTFFYFKLAKQARGYKYQNIRRWSKKVDLFTKDKVIIPIHLGNHWALGVINLRDRRFEYYDSIRSEMKGRRILKNLQRYIEDESMDKKKKAFDTSDWDFYIAHSPQQRNCFDCGMFSLKTANFVSQDLDLTFSQKNMPYFRRRMCHEILNIFIM